MAFSPKTWFNRPSTATPLDAAGLNDLETRIDGLDVDASTTVKGMAKLSAAPAAPTNPIAVGTNDARVVADAAAGTASIRTLGLGALQALAGTTRLDQLAPPTADVALNSRKLTGLGTPTLTTDATTKGYVDALIEGISWKDSVRAATTANITLSGTQTVDGVALIAGNRVLVKAQTTGAANGLYTVAAGAWTRTTDADTSAEINGVGVFVEAGTTQANQVWVLQTDAPTLDTTPLVFVQIGSGGSGHTIQEEGTGLAARAGLNFTGAGVTATDDAGNNRTNVTIPEPAPSIVSPGNLGIAYSLDCSVSKNRWLVGTLNANVTITLTGLTAGCAFRLLLTQDATGGRTVTLSDGAASSLIAVLTDASAASVADGAYDGTNTYVSLPGTGGTGRATPLPTFRELGPLNASGLKLAGTLPIAKPDNTYVDYWGAGFDTVFIDSQIAASRKVNANCVKVVCDTATVNVFATQTLSAFLANLKIVLDKLDDFFVYISVTSNPLYAGQSRATLAQEGPTCTAICSLADDYPNVVGFDLLNEINGWQPDRGGSGSYAFSQPDSTSNTWITTLLAAARAGTSKPLTIGLYAESTTSLLANTAADWLPVLTAAGIDFIDFHPYWPTSADVQVSDVVALHALYPSMPIMIGEVSVVGKNAVQPEVKRRIEAMRPLVELPYVAGTVLFTLNDYIAPAPSYGMFETDMVNERPNMSYPFRTLPRRSSYGNPQSFQLGVKSDLPASLTQVSNAKFSLSPAQFEALRGRDPMWRINALVGPGTAALVNGDSVTLSVVDLDTSTTLATVTQAVAATLVDASAGDLGTAQGTSSAGNTGFGTALTLNGSQLATFADNFRPEGAQPFTTEFWVKRARTLAGAENFFAQWAGGANADANLAMQFTADTLAVLWINGSDTFTQLNSAATITDTNWHYIAVAYDGTTMRLYIDGTLSSSVATTRQTAKISHPWTVGGITGGAAFQGSFDELRISKSARYTSGTHTVPTAPFVHDANTKRLVHFDDTVSIASADLSSRIATGWAYLPPGSPNVGLKAQNATGARGALLSATLEVRYA